MIIRIFDIFFSVIGLVILLPLILFIFFICFFDTKSPIFKQKRMGKNLKSFTLYKFRTMYVGVESVATHLSSSNSVTPLGKFLRKSKIDEIPQLLNVLLGDMSLVGPRPNLLNQEILIFERSKRGIYDYKPGISGLSQIKNIDMSDPIMISETDYLMLSNLNFLLYLKIIFLTLIGNGYGDKIIKNKFDENN
jgi:O-antigen biosynthesis protein WbqP